MEYNLSLLLRSAVGETRHFPVDGVVTGVDETDAPIPVTGSVHLIRTNQGVLARVRAALHSTEECARCLNQVTNPIDISFEEVFYPSVDPVTGHPLPPPPEPDAYQIDHNHLLNLGEAIREYAVIERPVQPLCIEDCAGLCPTCGVDRNTTSCNCAEPPADPRWATLWQLNQQE